MTPVEVNQSNQNPETLVTTLSQHEFVSLSTMGDSTQIAVRTYQNQGVVCCDILVFREANRTGKALQTEVALLIQTLEHLQSQLPASIHHLNSTFQSHTISFLGRKAHVLTDSTAQSLYCQMVPLILYQTDGIFPSIREQAAFYPVQVIHTSHLGEFLTHNLPQRSSPPDAQNTNVHELKESNQKLGLSLILFPLFLGLSGILASLGFLPIALVTLALGILGPVILIHRATKSFEQFRIRNMIPVQAAQPLRTSNLQSNQDAIESETLPHLRPTHPPTSAPDVTNNESARVPSHRGRMEKSEGLHQ